MSRYTFFKISKLQRTSRSIFGLGLYEKEVLCVRVNYSHDELDTLRRMYPEFSIEVVPASCAKRLFPNADWDYQRWQHWSDSQIVKD
jgi:hypothetical protein